MSNLNKRIDIRGDMICGWFETNYDLKLLKFDRDLVKEQLKEMIKDYQNIYGHTDLDSYKKQIPTMID
jgi:hypothetical protein